MQRPTCTLLRVRTPSDAHVIFHAVSLNLLPIVTRRLDTEERRSISSGCVFVWEERGSNTEATGLGIERWTDSIRWGPSRVKDEFLFYHEKEPEQNELEMTSDSSDTMLAPHQLSRGFYRENLIKQTYSVFVETPRGRRKWHLIAYFTQDSLDYLHTIDDIDILANLHVPPGKYKSARSAKGRPLTRDPLLMSHVNLYNSNLPHQYTAFPSGHPYPISSPHYTTAPIGPVRGATARRQSLVDSILHSPGHARPRSASGKLTEGLAPLAYLQNIPPPRRHPVDEEALMSFPGFPA